MLMFWTFFSAQMQMDLEDIEKLLDSVIQLDVVGIYH